MKRDKNLSEFVCCVQMPSGEKYSNRKETDKLIRRKRWIKFGPADFYSDKLQCKSFFIQVNSQQMWMNFNTIPIYSGANRAIWIHINLDAIRKGWKLL